MRTELPYVVLQAQYLTRENSELKRFMLDHMRKLSTLNEEEKVLYAREKIDLLLKTDNEYEHSSCERGCHFCCFQPISLSQAEAQTLKPFFTSNQFESQLAQKNYYNEGATIEYQDKACLFLEEGECSVYEHRPLICRLTYVESSPEKCHLESNEEGIFHRPVTKAALVAAAYYMSSPSTDLLVNLL